MNRRLEQFWTPAALTLHGRLDAAAKVDCTLPASFFLLCVAAWRSSILGAEGMRSSENPAIGVTMIQRPNPSPVHQTKG